MSFDPFDLDSVHRDRPFEYDTSGVPKFNGKTLTWTKAGDGRGCVIAAALRDGEFYFIEVDWGQSVWAGITIGKREWSQQVENIEDGKRKCQMDLDKRIKLAEQDGIEPQYESNIRNKPLVYLACPYSSPDARVRRERLWWANRVAADLILRGQVVFSPISHTAPIAEEFELPIDFDFWKAFDRTYLICCHRLFVLKIHGWKESNGVQWEIEFAKSIRIPLVYVIVDETKKEILGMNDGKGELVYLPWAEL